MKLTLDKIRKPIIRKIQRGISMDLCDFVDEINGDILDFDVFLPSKNMNLQRPLVWTLQQKQELIISILKGIELPTISVIIYKDEETRKLNKQIIKIIDGKQRITTIISFVKNEFPLTVKGIDYYYTDLEDDALCIFRTFTFRSDRMYEYPDDIISDNDKIAWFEMINFAGTPQDIAHLNLIKQQ